jgi:hypothetical protein
LRSSGKDGGARRQQGGAPLDRLGDIRFKRMDLQIEFGGDGGEADVAIETGQEAALAGSLLEDRRMDGKVLTHGTLFLQTRDATIAASLSAKLLDIEASGLRGA